MINFMFDFYPAYITTKDNSRVLLIPMQHVLSGRFIKDFLVDYLFDKLSFEGKLKTRNLACKITLVTVELLIAMNRCNMLPETFVNRVHFVTMRTWKISLAVTPLLVTAKISLRGEDFFTLVTLC